MPPLPDPDRLRLPSSATAPIRLSTRPPRHRPQERFVKGPIPWAWLDRAGQLPGKALGVGLVLWQKAGVTRKRTVRVCQARTTEMGLNEASARRGIRHLEQAGLIEVRRAPGQGLQITLLDVRESFVGSSDEGTRIHGDAAGYVALRFANQSSGC